MIRIRRLYKSFQYAVRGLFKIFREEQNLQVQTGAAAVVILLSWLFSVTHLEWCLLVFAIGLVILTEIVNSAVERITDVLSPRINGYAKEIKDITAAAVMFAAVIAVIIGLIVLGPYFLRVMAS